MLGNDHAEIQAAFTGLMANPLVTPWRHPELHMLVHRHATTLSIWVKRVGYLLVGSNRCYRLRRPSIGGRVALPAATPPPRGQLVLLLYAASCLEASAGESLTLQELSDDVARLVQINGGWPYDPNRRPDRQRLLAAVHMLTTYGVLEERTSGTLQNDWERTGSGIGAGYLLHRDALMLLVDTDDVDLALARRIDSSQDARGQELLRMLVECQALYPEELSESHRDYLTRQRSRVVERAEELTGGRVEVRSDALILVMPASRELPEGLVCGFPDATTLDWVALAMIDALCPGATGFHRVSADRVLGAAVDIHRGKEKQLTVALRESPTAIRDAVAGRLSELGLLRVEAGDWILTPAVGRYRDAELTSGEEE